MGSLMVSLRNAAGSMGVFEKAMGVVQSNVTNASTPGYARQRVEFQSQRIQPELGLSGGVTWSGTLDSRSSFAEDNVRKRATEFGAADEMAAQLKRVEPLFDITGDSGVPGALTNLVEAFSALTTAPNDNAMRQTAIDRATQVADSFHALSNGLAEASHTVDRSLQDQVGTINSTLAKIVEINREFRSDARAVSDAGLQAQMATLQEDLSESGDFTILKAEDGSATIFLGGQVMVAAGDKAYPLSVDASGAQTRLLDSHGQDVTDKVAGGRISSLLTLRNSTLPEHQSEIDRMAQVLADTVNTALGGGVDRTGQPPTQNLFEYDAGLGAARTLRTNALQPGDLALADSSAPGGNGVALKLADLSQAKSIDGLTFSEFYGNRAASLGLQLQSAKESVDTKTQLVAQARQLRDEVQQVDLNEEAILIIQYQRGYQASAKLVQTLNDMTEIALGLLR
ncbi:flagellar hook-associated protein FlgK [Paludibaculum fermentans]|uniref:Flagellar hook-associated protein 1 n=1 Tax=Paludibaculum fermentans TaxID=1473598 RepID=A0A7S7NNB0_PALFE|nr:flagellar hook-associated protein FlgK [Paludibaculum fermentans]QOY86750.1 flagellar hook-associated protein FlgK [Paludibaculum fermentans]